MRNFPAALRDFEAAENASPALASLVAMSRAHVLQLQGRIADSIAELEVARSLTTGTALQQEIDFRLGALRAVAPGAPAAKPLSLSLRTAFEFAGSLSPLEQAREEAIGPVSKLSLVNSNGLQVHYAPTWDLSRFFTASGGLARQTSFADSTYDAWTGEGRLSGAVTRGRFTAGGAIGAFTVADSGAEGSLDALIGELSTTYSRGRGRDVRLSAERTDYEFAMVVSPPEMRRSGPVDTLRLSSAWELENYLLRWVRLELGGSLHRDRTEGGYYDSDSFGLDASAFAPVRLFEERDATLLLTLGHRGIDFTNPIQVSANGLARSDARLTSSLLLVQPMADRHTTLELQYRYLGNDSNVSGASYSSHGVSAGVRYTF